MLEACSPSEPIAQRARGEARISLSEKGLNTLFQSGCLKLLRPKRHRDEAVLINTSGGLTSGDELKLHAHLQENAKLTVTTQAAERVYQGANLPAIVRNEIDIAQGAQCHWLPQETIIYNEAKLARSLKVNMSKGATFFGLETLVFGRSAMGEICHELDLSDRYHIEYANEPILFEHLRIQDEQTLTSPFGFGGAQAVASAFFVAENAEDSLALARSLCGDNGAVSASGNLLLARFINQNARLLRLDVTHFLRGFLKQELPEVWRL